MEKPKIVPLINSDYDFSKLQGKQFVAISIDPETRNHHYHFNDIKTEEIIFMCNHLIHDLLAGNV